MDELSPLFQEIEFHDRFRGYDPDEVDAYVDRVSKAGALAEGRLVELRDRVDAAEGRLAEGGGSETEETLRRTLVIAQRTADAAVSEAREEAAGLVANAEANAQSTITTADARADAQLRDAEERSTRLMAEAETDRRTLVAEAEAVAATAATAMREKLETEVGDLSRTRDFLRDDIEILERHLREQRARLVSSVATLSDLLETPDALRVESAPATSGVEAASVGSSQPPPDAPELEHVDDVVIPAAELVADVVEEVEPIEVAEVAEPMEEVAEVIDEADLDAAHEPVAEEIDVRAVPEADADEAVRQELDDEEFDEEPTPEFAPHDAAAKAGGHDDDDDIIDLVAEERAARVPRGAATEAAGDDGHDQPAPTRLVTAADLDADPGVAGAAVDAGPATAPVPVMEESSLFGDPDTGDDDPFLAQLRDAVATDEMPNDDDALSAFFDQDDDDSGRSWFGRRR